uniref:Uncharacterized protein n=1 Tax=Arundo donax TaxID=35708 RepID=A0A0A9HSH1_ARUDO
MLAMFARSCFLPRIKDLKFTRLYEKKIASTCSSKIT